MAHLTAPDTDRTAPGVYVHVPFCLRRCDYCDFTTFAGRDEAIPRYVDALCTHLGRALSRPVLRDLTESGRNGREVQDLTAGAAGGTTFGSVFVGGGTPTYLPAPDLQRVLSTIGATHDLADGAEFTVEANPETVTPDIAAALVEGGANRVSLGAQSFDTRVLGVLGRWHDPASVETAIARLRDAGIDRLSVDLIYGTPGETDASWRASLDRAVSLGVTHVSAYALTVEPNTPYAARTRTEPALAPDEDVQAARMAIAEERLSAAGMRRYEVSNWAVPGHESTHNLTYWRGGEWLAYGSGAHGSWQGRRYWLVRDPERYAAMIATGEEPLGGQEHPDADQRRLERLMMGLRITEGVARADVEPLDQPTLDRLTSAGLVTADADRVALTPAGMPLAGAVIRELA